MRVLIVEDEPDLAGAIRKALVEEGFAVDVAEDGEVGIFKAESWEYDLVVLDLMLPVVDGWEVLRRLRRKKKTPVLILTARDAVADKVKGLDLGADDYLAKPFELDELLARIRSLLRRAASQPSPVVEVGELQVDTAAKTVRRGGTDVELTAREYALLELFTRNLGKLVTRSMVYDHLYDESDPTGSNVVDVYVANLRRKLGKDFIETRRGQGYILRA